VNPSKIVGIAKSTMRTRIPFAPVDIIEALFMLFNL
jgi:hypothetical protein